MKKIILLILCFLFCLVQSTSALHMGSNRSGVAATHASTHVTGSTDAIQSATNAQNGLATSTHITAIEGAVPKSLFDATTFIYATSDNTPAVKTPAEVNQILGSMGGNISIKTNDYEAAATDFGTCIRCNKATDMTVTLLDGTVDNQWIEFEVGNATGDCIIYAASGHAQLADNGTKWSTLTATVWLSRVRLYWDATNSTWHTDAVGIVTGSTP